MPELTAAVRVEATLAIQVLMLANNVFFNSTQRIQQLERVIAGMETQ